MLAFLFPVLTVRGKYLDSVFNNQRDSQCLLATYRKVHTWLYVNDFLKSICSYLYSMLAT